MVDENDNRLASVMREVVKNSDGYIEQMLIYDLLRRNHLETYLRNTLRQIELCLDKNVDKFIHTSEYKQAKGLFQDKEMEYQGWTENYGNQVRVKEENLRLLEKAAEEKREREKEKEREREREKEKEKQKKVPHNEWEQKTNGYDIPKRKKKKEKRGKKGKNKGGRGVVRKWVESSGPKLEKSTINQSAWLEDTEKKKEKVKPKIETDISPMVRDSLKNYNLSLEGKKEPFTNLPRHKKSILRPLPSDCFISNISFSLYDKELPQGNAKKNLSSSYILENLDRLFTPEKQNLVFELGEELRPENLLPNVEDLPIEVDEFMIPCDLSMDSGLLFTTDFSFKHTVDHFFTIQKPDEMTRSAFFNLLKAYAPHCSEDMIRWLLQNNDDDYVDIIIEFLVLLRSENRDILQKALVILCLEQPVRLFNIHVLFKLKKRDIDAPPELMNKFVKSWFQYCNQDLQGENDEKIKHQQSMKKILAGFLKNTISSGSYDLGLLCREVDEFCSQNSSMSSVRKMKQVIDEKKKSHNKRRK